MVVSGTNHIEFVVNLWNGAQGLEVGKGCIFFIVLICSFSLIHQVQWFPTTESNNFLIPCYLNILFSHGPALNKVYTILPKTMYKIGMPNSELLYSSFKELSNNFTTTTRSG